MPPRAKLSAAPTLGSSLWSKILTSPSSSQAIREAASIHPIDLNDATLPVPVEELSAHARENLFAVVRALDVSIPNLPYDPWELWSDTDEIPEDRQTSCIRPQAEKDAPVLTTTTTSSRIDPEMTQSNKTKEASQTLEGKPTKDAGQGNMVPSAQDKQHAAVLHTWAHTCPHTTAPDASLSHVSQSPAFESLLPILVPSTATPTLRAAVLTVLHDKIPTSSAAKVLDFIILHFLESLKVAATREMLSAILTFSGCHPRTSVSLFTHFASKPQPIPSPVAEVLARIAPTLSEDAALQSFKAIASATWADSTIPLATALITKCRASGEIPGQVVLALDRNVVGLGKSVRFGKLLLSVVDEIPILRQDSKFKQRMETICLRSTAFLAKRALALLRTPQSTS